MYTLFRIWTQVFWYEVQASPTSRCQLWNRNKGRCALCLLSKRPEVRVNLTPGVTRSFVTSLTMGGRLTMTPGTPYMQSFLSSPLCIPQDWRNTHVPSAAYFFQGTGVQVGTLTLEREQWLHSNTWCLVLSYCILMPLAKCYTKPWICFQVSVKSCKTSPFTSNWPLSAFHFC